MIDNKGVERFIESHMSCPECREIRMGHYHSAHTQHITISCESCGCFVKDPDRILRTFWEEMFKSGVLIKGGERNEQSRY